MGLKAQTLIIHGIITIIYSAVVFRFVGFQDGIFATWGSALSVLPALGFGYLLGKDTAKKGVALVLAGSVLRYGVFLIVFALLVFAGIRLPIAIMGGLLTWIPSAFILAAINRRTQSE